MHHAFIYTILGLVLVAQIVFLISEHLKLKKQITENSTDAMLFARNCLGWDTATHYETNGPVRWYIFAKKRPWWNPRSWWGNEFYFGSLDSVIAQAQEYLKQHNQLLRIDLCADAQWLVTIGDTGYKNRDLIAAILISCVSFSQTKRS